MSMDVNEKSGSSQTPESGASTSQSGAAKGSSTPASGASTAGQSAAAGATARTSSAGVERPEEMESSARGSAASAQGASEKASATGSATAGAATSSKSSADSTSKSTAQAQREREAEVSQTASGVSYVVGPVTGFMYLAAHRDKPEVRFHACRSILISAVILVAWIAIYVLSFSVLGLPLIFWAGLGFLIYMAVMTIKKQPLEIPLLGEYTKKFADKMAPGGGK